MNRPFITDNFMLQSDEAVRLYHDYAADQPIIDYHCHLPPEEVAQDVSWENISQVWLNGDHYKWRQMRTNGIDEYFCTGGASDREKFDKFAETLPHLLRNPIYHWSHLELARYFGIDDCVLSPKTADSIWERTQARFAKGLSARQLMTQSRVKLVCTTDDPADSLEHHKAVLADPFGTQMLPTWRPDKAMAIEQGQAYNAYLDRLGAAADIEINSYARLLEALYKRHDYFASVGCKLSDHGITTCWFAPATEAEIVAIFDKARAGHAVNPTEEAQFKTAMLLEFGRMDAAKGWTKQLHIGAMRNNNSRMFEQLGPDTGYDSIGDWQYAEPLSRLLDTLNSEDALPKTIIYNLHPRDNEVIATLIGNFQDGSVAGKLQFGSGWWFLDQKDGMERQLEALSQLGSLGRFVGMLTDSRSFLSYTRHEYFRRVLCNLLGRDMVEGAVPYDFELIGQLVENISYHNAANYFGFDL